MLRVARSPNEIERELTRLDLNRIALETLANLYQHDRDLFFEVAVIGVSAGAETWQKELASLASEIGVLARHGYQITSGTSGERALVGGPVNITIDPTAEQAAISFIEEVRGSFEATGRRRDFVGREASESEVVFKLGSAAERGEATARISHYVNARPMVLELDQQDCDAIQHGMPAYAVYDLIGCATRVVAAPTSVFEGTRVSGNLSLGRAYCGKPRKTYTNSGVSVPAPKGMVYCVYADQDGYVYDWDWVREDPQHPGHPVNFEERFSRLVEDPQETSLSVPRIVPAAFKKLKAWHSFRGDCMFFYASDAPAYAIRINDDLTEYRALESDQLVGCKVKNFEEILSKVTRETDGSSVPVGAILAASLVRQLEDHQRREKEYFLRILASIHERSRTEFLELVLKLNSDAPDYLRTICDLAVQYSTGLPVVEMQRSVDARQQTEEMYLQLIAFAGNSKVSMRRVAAA